MQTFKTYLQQNLVDFHIENIFQQSKIQPFKYLLGKTTELHPNPWFIPTDWISEENIDCNFFNKIKITKSETGISRRQLLDVFQTETKGIAV